MERPSPEAMQQLQHRFQAAMQEIADLKKQNALAREEQSSPEKDAAGDPDHPANPNVDELAKKITTWLRTAWLISVLCIAMIDVLMK